MGGRIMGKEIPFESQTITIIERIMKDKNVSREDAVKLWLNSKTYNEILKRKLTYISAMRAYYELNLEIKGSSEWMKKDFE